MTAGGDRLTAGTSAHAHASKGIDMSRKYRTKEILSYRSEKGVNLIQI